MKSYTDLEQSKKLAEILPLESADGFYEAQINPFTNKWEDILFVGNEWASDEVVIPAWSLAALYGILPNNKKETTTLSRGGMKIEPIEYLDNWWCEYKDNNYTKDFIVSADNPIDACYEIIIKLHELKML